MVKVCVTGCLHGELDKVYADVLEAEKSGNFKTDVILCCGDFQSIRNPTDLACMSVPPKYNAMGDFWRYYAEERQAPVLTLFIGGNHESSGYLQELPYGGWIAPNIWYMGYAGVVQLAGLRIAGLSGIYKQHDYTMGHFERLPYSESTKRSVYHIRNSDVFRLGQIRRPLDIVLSHDWPRGIYHYGDSRDLLRKKPFFAEEIDSDALGSPPGEQLLCRLRPRYWFSAHLHCSFAAAVEFSDSPPDQPQVTRFLALDKCLPRRDYLRFIDIEPSSSCYPGNNANASHSGEHDNLYMVSRTNPSATSLGNPTDSAADTDETTGLFLDPEWLCILRSTNHLMSTAQVPCILPGRNAHERCDFSVTDEELRALHDLFGGEFAVPENFERTAPAYKPNDSTSVNAGKFRTLVKEASLKQQLFSNPQTELLCAMLDLINPNALLLGRQSFSLNELSSDLVAKEAEREAEALVDVDDAPLGDAGHRGQGVLGDPSDTNQISSHYSPEPQDTFEYDPLQNVCISPSRKLGQSPPSAVRIHNPEEVDLGDICEDDDDDQDEEVVNEQRNDAACEASTTTTYSPQPITALRNDDEDCVNSSLPTAGSPGGGYSPAAQNAEEILLSDDAEDSEDVTA